MEVSKFLEDVSNSTGIPVEDLYCTQNGKIVHGNVEGELRWEVRLVGGKGGFGSMLRAIGAQIEKTTNREACRDLSGRRLRDIREEQRLREWASQRQQREEEAEARKNQKNKKLAEPPKFEFKDETYEKARSALEENVDSAVEKGFQVAASTSGSATKTRPPKRKSTKLWIDEDLSDLSTDDSDNEEDSKKTDSTSSDNSNQNKSDSDEPVEKRSRLSASLPDHKAITA